MLPCWQCQWGTVYILKESFCFHVCTSLIYVPLTFVLYIFVYLLGLVNHFVIISVSLYLLLIVAHRCCYCYCQRIVSYFVPTNITTSHFHWFQANKWNNYVSYHFFLTAMFTMTFITSFNCKNLFLSRSLFYLFSINRYKWLY